MDYKQILVVRKDLGMRKGKMIVQGSHASLTAVFNTPQDVLSDWIESGQTKICVGANSEEELIEIYENAKTKGFPCSLIRDKGLTEFDGPTLTAVGIGPGTRDGIDKITGKLKLL